jgi:hypothetical protein
VSFAQALPDVRELAVAVLNRLHLPAPQLVGEDLVGYPLSSSLTIHASDAVGFESSRRLARTVNPVVEISGPFNVDAGHFRVGDSEPFQAFLCLDSRGRTAGGILFRVDGQDQCVRVVDLFSTDGQCAGVLFARVVQAAGEQFGSAYIEVDVLIGASRLLKTCEQLGFVPVAYLPGFHSSGSSREDVVKLVKLNIPCEEELEDLTVGSRGVADAVHRCFDDQRLGLATVKLLRPLAMFAGLGDGDLRKIARLFMQRLFRSGETVFAKGDTGKEAYIVLRGQVDILLDLHAPVVASLSNGKIFGELAFLDGGPRSTYAVAAQPSIVLVLQQEAFLDLTRREPALGMTVVRNMALDISSKLRNADEGLAKREHS